MGGHSSLYWEFFRVKVCLSKAGIVAPDSYPCSELICFARYPNEINYKKERYCNESIITDNTILLLSCLDGEKIFFFKDVYFR